MAESSRQKEQENRRNAPPDVLVLRFVTLRSFSHDERRFPSKLTRCSRSLRSFLNQNRMLYIVNNQIQNHWSSTCWIEMKADENSMKSTLDARTSRVQVIDNQVNKCQCCIFKKPAPICKLQWAQANGNRCRLVTHKSFKAFGNDRGQSNRRQLVTHKSIKAFGSDRGQSHRTEVIHSPNFSFLWNWYDCISLPWPGNSMQIHQQLEKLLQSSPPPPPPPPQKKRPIRPWSFVRINMKETRRHFRLT